MSTRSQDRPRPGERAQSAEERALRRYFREVPQRPPSQRERGWAGAGLAAVLVGLLFSLTADGVTPQSLLGIVLILGGGATSARNFYRILRQRHRYWQALREIFPRPGDREVDELLHRRREELVAHSLNKLGVEPEPGTEPLWIRRGIPWYTPGIAPEDHVTRRGDDGVERFAIYGITVIWLTRDRLCAYRCDYNFLRAVPVNEHFAEYYYQDVVSISAQEESSSLTLPTGESVTSVQKLRISVSNSEFFIATLGSTQLRRVNSGEGEPPSSDVERTLSAIRKKLEESKRALAHPAAGRAASLR